MIISVESALSREKLIINLTLSVLVLALFAGAFFINPGKVNFVTCFFHTETGLSCPTCGLTRSFFSFSHLHVVQAFRFHLFGPILYLVLVIFLLKWLGEIVTKRVIQLRVSSKNKKIALISFLTGWFSYFAIRMAFEIMSR